MALIALVGRPNVGKSTLFNRLIGQRKAIESDLPGTTRDRIYGQIENEEQVAILSDLAGLTDNESDQLTEKTKEQIGIAIEKADLIIMVTSAIDGVLNEDHKIADYLRKQNKPVLLAVNKSDNRVLDAASANFMSLGFPDTVAVSAIHNSGISDLTDLIWQKLPRSRRVKAGASRVKVAIIGRPNVGKSTLLNHYAGEKRAIVSDLAGTTRDSIEISVTHHNDTIDFLDTAGFRHRGQVGRGIEKYSFLRTLSAVEEADISVLLIDPKEGAVAGDAKAAGVAAELNKGLIIAVNKWDLYGDTDDDSSRERILNMARETLEFVPWAPVIFISGKDGLNDRKLLELIVKVKLAREQKISDDQTAKIITEAAARHPHLPKIYSLKQFEKINEPIFRLEINRPESWHFSFSRFIENLIREQVPFNGTAIKIETVAHSR